MHIDSMTISKQSDGTLLGNIFLILEMDPLSSDTILQKFSPWISLGFSTFEEVDYVLDTILCSCNYCRHHRFEVGWGTYVPGLKIIIDLPM